MFAFESSGKREASEIKSSEKIKLILSFLNNSDLWIDNPPSQWTFPTEVAVFYDDKGKELFDIWCGVDWISCQEGSDSPGAQKLRLEKAEINKLRSMLKL